MAAEFFVVPYQCVVVSGLAVPGAKLTFYQTGTTTKLPIYTTSALTTERTNPVVANGAGHIPDTYLNGSLTYRVQFRDKNGTLLEDVDPYVPGVTELGITLTTAAGSSVNTRVALAAIAAVNNQTAYLTEAGREGWFVFSTANLSSQVTADTGQGVYVPPSSDTDGSSGAWVRVLENPKVFRASWFGVLTTNSEATNTAIVDAILAQYLPGNVTLIFSDGLFPVRVRVPYRAETYLSTVTVMGETAPSTFFGSILGPPYTMTTKGTILLSTATAPNTDSGGTIEVLTSGTNWSTVHLAVRNLHLRTYDNPSQHGIMAKYAQQLTVHNVQIDTGIWSTAAAEPTGIGIGIRTPTVGNDGWISIRDVSINGYFIGCDINEHQDVDNLSITACKFGAQFLVANHSSRIGLMTFHRTKTPMAVFGAHYTTIQQVGIEHVNPALGTASGGITIPGDIPGSANGWQVTNYDLDDASGHLRGVISYSSVLGGVGQETTFTKNGGKLTKVVRAGDIVNQAAWLQTTNVSMATGAPGVGHRILNAPTAILTNRLFTLASGEITIPDKGYYRVRSRLEFESNSTGWRRVIIYLDPPGSELFSAALPAANGAVTTAQIDEVFHNDTGTVKIIVAGEHNAGVNLNVTGSVQIEQV